MRRGPTALTADRLMHGIFDEVDRLAEQLIVFQLLAIIPVCEPCWPERMTARPGPVSQFAAAAIVQGTARSAA